MPRLPWALKPVAHRGLHDAGKGIVENTITAVQAAIAKGYHVEIDVQAAKGDVPVMFHDETLDRLMQRKGRVVELTPAELGAIAYRGSADRIVTLDAALAAIGGAAPLYLEVKTSFGRPGAYERNIARSLAAYSGPVAVMSFDHWSLEALQAAGCERPLGVLSYRWDDGWMQEELPFYRRWQLRWLTKALALRAAFIAYDIDDLPALPPLLARRLLGLPLLTWTVRTGEQRATAQRYADAVIFEGYEP